MTTPPLTDPEIFCVMCKEPVPLDRLKKRSITCSEKCQKERTAFLHRRVAAKKCRYCMRPATPEEQAAFRRFRKWEREQGVAGNEDKAKTDNEGASSDAL
jgi:hypothetical protein